MLPSRFKSVETPEERMQRSVTLELKITSLRREIEQATARLAAVCDAVPVSEIVRTHAATAASTKEQAALEQQQQQQQQQQQGNERAMSDSSTHDTQGERGNVSATVEHCKSVVKGHIDRLHQYNEMRDFGCGMHEQLQDCIQY
jgi:hypothetical protein